MINAITERSLIGLLKKLHAQGLTTGDLSHGISVNESGNYYCVFEQQEDTTGVIDTSSGKAGISVATMVTNDALAEIGSNRTAVTASVITPTTPAASVSEDLHAVSNVYVIPRTVKIEDTNVATSGVPTLIDDGKGLLIGEQTGRKYGTVDYTDGAIVITYHGNLWPQTSITVDYEYSADPCAVNMPNAVRLSHMICKGNANDTATVTIYETSASSDAAIVVQESVTLVGGVKSVDLKNRISIQRERALAKRDHRWVASTDVTRISSVALYWESV